MPATPPLAPSRAADRRAAQAPIAQLPGAGPALLAALERLGLRTLQDLWFHLPLRYEDKTRITPIRDLRAGEVAQIEGRVEAVEKSFRYRPQLRVAVSDESRQTLLLRFFHFSNAQVIQLAIGTRLRCFGEVRHGQHSLEMVHPQYRRLAGEAEVAVEERMSPVYPITEGLGQKRLAGLVEK